MIMQRHIGAHPTISIINTISHFLTNGGASFFKAFNPTFYVHPLSLLVIQQVIYNYDDLPMWVASFIPTGRWKVVCTGFGAITAPKLARISELRANHDSVKWLYTLLKSFQSAFYGHNSALESRSSSSRRVSISSVSYVFTAISRIVLAADTRAAGLTS